MSTLKSESAASSTMGPRQPLAAVAKPPQPACGRYHGGQRAAPDGSHAACSWFMVGQCARLRDALDTLPLREHASHRTVSALVPQAPWSCTGAQARSRPGRRRRSRRPQSAASPLRPRCEPVVAVFHPVPQRATASLSYRCSAHRAIGRLSTRSCAPEYDSSYVLLTGLFVPLQFD